MRLVNLSPDASCRLADLHGRSFPKGEAWTAEAIRSLLDQETCCGWGLVDGHALCAMVLYQGVAPEADLLTICTAPQARRAGHARTLLVSSLAEMSALGFDTIMLEVSVRNAGARRLYDSAGFEEVAVRPNYYAGGREGAADAHLMVAKIAGQTRTK
jgi:ribosomal-protein-alanine N-acetyltransferase